MSEQQTKDQIAAVMLLHGTAEQQKSAIEYCSTPIAQPAPQGVAEVMELVDLYAESQPLSYAKRASCNHVITAIITERDTLRERVAELERDAPL